MNPFKEVGTVKQRNKNILSNEGAPVMKIVFITSILESQLFLSKTVVNSVLHLHPVLHQGQGTQVPQQLNYLNSVLPTFTPFPHHLSRSTLSLMSSVSKKLTLLNMCPY